MPLKKAAAKPKDAKEDGGEKKPKKAEGGGDSTWVEPTTVVVKPPEQLQLSEKELDAEHTRLMSAKDPVAPQVRTPHTRAPACVAGARELTLQMLPPPQNIIRFNFKEKVYKLDATVDQCACHFEMEGNLLHRDTEEGKKIVAEQEAKRVAEERAAEMQTLQGGEGGEGGGGSRKSCAINLTTQSVLRRRSITRRASVTL